MRNIQPPGTHPIPPVSYSIGWLTVCSALNHLHSISVSVRWRRRWRRHKGRCINILDYMDIIDNKRRLVDPQENKYVRFSNIHAGSSQLLAFGGRVPCGWWTMTSLAASQLLLISITLQILLIGVCVGRPHLPLIEQQCHAIVYDYDW